ncbi:hypothetical protein J2Z48_001968 [Croceifilum oryzae]|uniref:Uncharacterized protein n=1 Tax=Croceifilum oryzae TaxID=1553429 RepID=A0AAJ1TN50_9BACL|nr:hypothetical protein [Croceifilum oryzae]MDQ0417795.1 hypothetical protein [Croceifilum oryzae]
MKVTLNLSKAELDLIEEAILQYQNLLHNAKTQSRMVENELHLCQRVMDEFGIEEEREDGQEHAATQDPLASMDLDGSSYPFSR